MNLTSILPLEAVLPHLPARDKKHALKITSAKAAELTGIPEREIYGVLLEREHIGCTGMGNGVCIPHGRMEELKKVQAIFARLEKPVEFGAADHKPVDLIFLLITPISANTDHIKALATASRLLRDKQLVENIRKTTDAKIMHGLLMVAAERDAA